MCSLEMAQGRPYGPERNSLIVWALIVEITIVPVGVMNAGHVLLGEFGIDIVKEFLVMESAQRLVGKNDFRWDVPVGINRRPEDMVDGRDGEDIPWRSVLCVDNGKRISECVDELTCVSPCAFIICRIDMRHQM